MSLVPVRPRAVARVGALSEAAFRAVVAARRPIVFRGLARGWPLAAWSIGDLAARIGDAMVTVTRTEGDTLAVDPRVGLVQQTRPLRGFLAGLAEGPSNGYVMAPFEELPEEIRAGTRWPAPIAESRFRREKLWISAAGTVSPLHRDAPDNVLVQIVGQKTARLFAPSDTRRVYPHPIWSSVPNFARVDPLAPDWLRFPRFRDATPYLAELGPGDALFLPSGFWHHVRSETDSVSVNGWWAEGARLAIAAAAEIFKRLRHLSR